MTIQDKLIAYSAWYIGQKEKKGNSGFESEAFEKELKNAGWYKGAAWCAFFVKLVVLKLFTGELLKAVRSQFNGSAKQTFDNVKKAGIFETGTEPEDGCICVCLLGYGPSGHMYIVEKAGVKENTATTIEGNTNASGSREGDRVARKLRTNKRAFKSDGLNVYGYIYLREKK